MDEHLGGTTPARIGTALPLRDHGRALLAPLIRIRALHDHVRDAICFGWGPRFYAERPAETLARRIGYSVTKSAALVSLLRANGFAARLVFAELDSRVMEGLMRPAAPWLDHALVEVDLAGETIAFDSHLVDLPLVEGAAAMLARSGRAAGYGIVSDATGRFPGWSQFAPGYRGRVWGAFDDVEALFASGAPVHNRLPWILRRSFAPLAAAANRRAEAVRALAG